MGEVNVSDGRLLRRFVPFAHFVVHFLGQTTPGGRHGTRPANPKTDCTTNDPFK